MEVRISGQPGQARKEGVGGFERTVLLHLVRLAAGQCEWKSEAQAPRT